MSANESYMKFLYHEEVSRCQHRRPQHVAVYVLLGLLQLRERERGGAVLRSLHVVKGDGDGPQDGGDAVPEHDAGLRERRGQDALLLREP